MRGSRHFARNPCVLLGLVGDGVHSTVPNVISRVMGAPRCTPFHSYCTDIPTFCTKSVYFAVVRVVGRYDEVPNSGGYVGNIFPRCVLIRACCTDIPTFCTESVWGVGINGGGA